MLSDMLMMLVAIVASLAALAGGGAFWRVRARERERADARVAALASALDPHPEDDRLPFSAQPGEPNPLRPLLTIASGFAVVAVAIITGAFVADLRSAPEPPSASETATQAAPQLSLIALRSEQNRDGLVVKGLVRTLGTAPPAGVTAVVVAFSREGRLLARADGPLRLQSLDPRARADFAVTVDRASEAARYQVSFRGPGGIIRHVDLRDRSSDTAAGAGAPASSVASRQTGTVAP